MKKSGCVADLHLQETKQLLQRLRCRRVAVPQKPVRQHHRESAAIRGWNVRVSGVTLVILGAIAALVALGVTDHVLPASDDRTAQLRPWLAARAMGVSAYLLLAFEVTLGLILSHPRNTASPFCSNGERSSRGMVTNRPPFIKDCVGPCWASDCDKKEIAKFKSEKLDLFNKPLQRQVGKSF